MKNINLNFQVPLTDALTETSPSNFIIGGTAITSTTTGNNHKFLAEELRKSTNTLKGVPLLVDHDNRVESIKGRVTDSSFDENNLKIDFKAKVMDRSVQEMIKDGRINAVSIGAIVESIEEDEKEGVIIPRGIKFKELSLVAVGADPNATFSQALKEAWDTSNVIEITSHSKETQNLKGGTIKAIMTEKTTDKVEESQNEKNNELLLKSITQKLEDAEKKLSEYKNKERKALEESYKALCVVKKVDSVDATNLSEETLNVLIKQVESIKEITAEKTKTEETKLVSQVEEESSNVVDKLRGFNVVQAQGSLRGGAFYITK